MQRSLSDISRHLVELDRCPGCGSQALRPMHEANDLHGLPSAAPELGKSLFTLCRDCALIFAARRRTEAIAEDYYAWFAHLESRNYDRYPPPKGYARGKRALAGDFADLFLERGWVRPGDRVLHLRCDFAALYEALAGRLGGLDYWGYDYFDSNLRYARDLGAESVAPLHPARLPEPEAAPFDFVVSNHILTHSFDPRRDARRLYDLVRPGGTVFLYNEVDHRALFDPRSDHYCNGELNNYHKQLLIRESLEHLLLSAGFCLEYLGRRNFTDQFAAMRPETPDGAANARALAELALRLADGRAEIRRLMARWSALRRSPIRQWLRRRSFVRLGRRIAAGADARTGGQIRRLAQRLGTVPAGPPGRADTVVTPPNGPR